MACCNQNSSHRKQTEYIMPTKKAVHEKDNHKWQRVIHRENSLKDTADAYNDWAHEYDDDLNRDSYPGPTFTAETVASCFPEELRGQVRLLDVAAGTGYLGEELKKLGFTLMDALEPAVAMCEKAKQKGLYENYINTFITDEPIEGVADNSYDVLVVSGGHMQGHIPAKACLEMVRLVKPGGFVCIGMREEYLTTVEDYKTLEPLMDQLEAEGKWKKQQRKIVSWYHGKPGVIFVFKVLKVT
ncbi:uncharacterized protein LOC106164449 isoform X1 [Lingula anatina]|uniref:Uncharacterized protein LOC106164449 isoform X1 n=2 Tax=Lingula anatina TaxID=7574 RepID=A0A1S3IHS8_LINAN|nr:uncharacterized protein LOC106164449 isoform X1 [Lingula anatina]|eukprot:XP_013397815.1 uncharacterized protein LOC106164449 isoform X1 [Lingula anatina]